MNFMIISTFPTILILHPLSWILYPAFYMPYSVVCILYYYSASCIMYLDSVCRIPYAVLFDLYSVSCMPYAVCCSIRARVWQHQSMLGGHCVSLSAPAGCQLSAVWAHWTVCCDYWWGDLRKLIVPLCIIVSDMVTSYTCLGVRRFLQKIWFIIKSLVELIVFVFIHDKKVPVTNIIGNQILFKKENKYEGKRPKDV